MSEPQIPADQIPDQGRDDLDWDVDRDGRMAEHATDDEPETQTYDEDSGFVEVDGLTHPTGPV